MNAGLLLVSLALLVGCAAAPSAPLQAPKARVQLDAVATLSVGDCDTQTAADETAVIVARRNAAALVRGARMSADTALRIQALADTARTALNRACRGGKLDASAVAEARAARAQINTLMRSTP